MTASRVQRRVLVNVMPRYEDEQDPKSPRPVVLTKKRGSWRESQESGKPERDRDRHMHVSA